MSNRIRNIIIPSTNETDSRLLVIQATKNAEIIVEQLREISQMKNDPNDYIYNFVASIKNKIDFLVSVTIAA